MARTVTEFTKDALDKLILLEAKLAGNVAYFVEPNMILALSGVRGFADQITYYKLASDKEKILAVFAAAHSIQDELGVQIFPQSSQNVSGKPFAGCEVINVAGLRRTVDATKLSSVRVPDTVPTRDAYLAWYSDFLENIAEGHKDISYIGQKDIAFGIILGYPDVAILSILKETEETGPDYMDARIACATRYVCPQPIYNYHKSLKDNPEITSHEQLWSEILQTVYDSAWHQRLAKDKDFIAVRALIEKY